MKIIHHKFVSVEDSACQGKRHQAIVGTIKNTGNFDWQHFKLEIKLQNESGDLLDGTQVDLYSLTVPANSECIFRAPIESLKLPAGSKNYSISIVTASNNNIF
ncbi:MAG: hypothetical protein IPK50_16400 [Fibrobacterota bacterium]|nr:hypothetical protein [Fibrobacterota bacterium]QQS03862.1 MAG: hypothetical protein IPK50_16400 [Fibrobacterota bacterium]